MALRGEIVDFIRLDLLNQPDQIGGIGEIAVVQKEMDVLRMKIAVQVLDPSAVERRRAPPQAVNDVTLLQEKLGEIRAVLPSHTRDKRNFRHNDPAMNGTGLGLRGGPTDV